MTAKKRINITVDAEVHKKAHELGLNVSKVCENALKDAVRRLEQPTTQTETNGGYADARRASPEQRKPRAGFEPATSALPRRCPSQLGHRGVRTQSYYEAIKNSVGSALVCP